MNIFLDKQEWVDIWRSLHPEKTQFTFRRRKPVVMTRLDYFLMPLSTSQYVQDCSIVPGFLSDHSFVELELETEEVIRGPGLWKLNTSLLYDSKYIEQINDILTKAEMKLVNIGQKADYVASWEETKYNIQTFTRKYSKDKAKERKDSSATLLRKLASAEKKLHMINLRSEHAIKHIENINVKIDELKSQLNKLEAYTTQGAVLRSKVKWYFEGDKNSKYFFRTGKE